MQKLINSIVRWFIFSLCVLILIPAMTLTFSLNVILHILDEVHDFIIRLVKPIDKTADKLFHVLVTKKDTKQING